jgi:hypothetical protein
MGLARIFHTVSSRGATNPDADTTGGRETAVETALALGGSPERARRAGASESTKMMDCDDGCMSIYCLNQSLTQHPFGFPASLGDWHEISGLVFLEMLYEVILQLL